MLNFSLFWFCITINIQKTRDCLIFFIYLISKRYFFMIAFLFVVSLKNFIQNIVFICFNMIMDSRWVSLCLNLRLRSNKDLKLKWIWLLFIFYNISGYFFLLIRVSHIFWSSFLYLLRFCLELNSNSLNWRYHFDWNRH